jgi:hypothetical protein
MKSIFLKILIPILPCILTATVWAQVDPFIRAKPSSVPPPLAQLLEALRAPALGRHIAHLADPAMGGRGLGEPGLEQAIAYVAAELDRAGLASPGSRFQRVSLTKVEGPGGTLELGSRTWRAGVDCLLPEIRPQALKGPAVFAGYGIREPVLGHDDLKGLDLRGRIVVIRGGLPPGSDWQRAPYLERYGAKKASARYASRQETLARLGARALVVLEEDLKPGPWAPYFLSGREGGLPLVQVASKEVPTGLGRATLRITGKVSSLTSRNVLALLPGSDPRLRSQAVVLGAHLDHLGIVGGRIHPGADDNASGVAALLEMAKALAAGPVRPKRSLIFAFWTGEEEGKLGSGQYVHRPLWPLARTRAYLNLDMIGHPWTEAELRKLLAEERPQEGEAFLKDLRIEAFAEVGLAGPGLGGHLPGLDATLAEAGSMAGMSLHLDVTDGRHGGSDYRDFARSEVPWLRFFGNYFPAYHEPGDTADQVDPAQVQRLARLALAAAWLLAN